MVFSGVLTVLAALLCLKCFHVTWCAAMTFIWLYVLIRIALIDLATMKIPDRWNLILGIIGMAAIPVMPGAAGGERLAGALIVSLPMIATDLIIPGGFGGGDIKLMGCAGLFLGWKKNLLAAFLALIAAGIYGGYLLFSKKASRKDSFAFGPFLCGGLAAAALTGDDLIAWYIGYI